MIEMNDNGKRTLVAVDYEAAEAWTLTELVDHANELEKQVEFLQGVIKDPIHFVTKKELEAEIETLESIIAEDRTNMTAEIEAKDRRIELLEAEVKGLNEFIQSPRMTAAPVLEICDSVAGPDRKNMHKRGDHSVSPDVACVLTPANDNASAYGAVVGALAPERLRLPPGSVVDSDGYLRAPFIGGGAVGVGVAGLASCPPFPIVPLPKTISERMGNLLEAYMDHGGGCLHVATELRSLAHEMLARGVVA